MKFSSCGSLTLNRENGYWFRAIDLEYWDIKDPLNYKYTKPVLSRFSPGRCSPPPDQFEIFYLAEDHQVALFEVEALLGSPATVVPSHATSWNTITVSVNLQSVADLCLVEEQRKLSTNAQELTGNWRGYSTRTAKTSVSEPIGIAPTQQLGLALFQTPEIEAFRTISAKIPVSKALVVFPAKLKKGSWLRFRDPKTGKEHQIDGTV